MRGTHIHTLTPPPSSNTKHIHQAPALHCRERNREGSPGFGTLHLLLASLLKQVIRGYNGGIEYREGGMGEHTAFLLLLAATLTVSSEVSPTEKKLRRWESVSRPASPYPGSARLRAFRELA